MVVQEERKTFYDDLCKDISSHLLSHKDIDKSLLECDKSSCVMNVKSWFSARQVTVYNKNSQNNYIQTFFPALTEGTVSSATVIKSRRIRIYPSQQQKQLFKQWFGVGRKVYNTCIHHFNEKDIVFK